MQSLSFSFFQRPFRVSHSFVYENRSFLTVLDSPIRPLKTTATDFYKRDLLLAASTALSGYFYFRQSRSLPAMEIASKRCSEPC